MAYLPKTQLWRLVRQPICSEWTNLDGTRLHTWPLNICRRWPKWAISVYLLATLRGIRHNIHTTNRCNRITFLERIIPPIMFETTMN